MRKVMIIEEKVKEVFESKIEYFLGDSQVDIVDFKTVFSSSKGALDFL